MARCITWLYIQWIRSSVFSEDRTGRYLTCGASIIHNSGKKKTVGRHKVTKETAPEDRWGTLVYINDQGEKIEEKVPVYSAAYEKIYDNLVEAIQQGKEKCIKDDEVIWVLELLEKATETAKSHKAQAEGGESL